LCAQFGEVIHCAIITNPTTKHSKGFAFVQYKDKDSCNKAINALNRYELAGLIMSVELARTQDPGKKRYGPVVSTRHYRPFTGSAHTRETIVDDGYSGYNNSFAMPAGYGGQSTQIPTYDPSYGWQQSVVASGLPYGAYTTQTMAPVPQPMQQIPQPQIPYQNIYNYAQPPVMQQIPAYPQQAAAYNPWATRTQHRYTPY